MTSPDEYIDDSSVRIGPGWIEVEVRAKSDGRLLRLHKEDLIVVAPENCSDEVLTDATRTAWRDMKQPHISRMMTADERRMAARPSR